MQQGTQPSLEISIMRNHYQGSYRLAIEVKNKTFIFKLHLDKKIKIHSVNQIFRKKLISLGSSKHMISILAKEFF
jgi:hypothetical protein